MHCNHLKELSKLLMQGLKERLLPVVKITSQLLINFIPPQTCALESGVDLVFFVGVSLACVAALSPSPYSPLFIGLAATQARVSQGKIWLV